MQKAEGYRGEALARRYVESLGYRVLAQDAVFPGAEIDLICEDGQTLVFIEVKLRSSTRTGRAREAVTPAKQRRICRGALCYMARHGLMQRQARFDVIEIQGGALTHLKDAFPYQGQPF